MATNGTLQGKAAKLRTELRETGRVVLRAPVLVRTAECAIRFMLGAILAGAEVLQGASPFALALVASSGSGLGGFSALLGACFGYLSVQGLTEGLRYVAAAILIFSVSFAFYDLKIYRRGWFMPVISAALAGCTGFVYLSAGGWTSTSIVLFIGELALTAAATYFYRTAFAPWSVPGDEEGANLRQMVSALILGATVLIALSKLDIWGGISVGRLAACIAVVLAAWKGGPGIGAAVGLSGGLAMDLAAGGIPYYSMAYGFAGLMTGVFWKQGKLFAALSYILANAVAVLWAWDSGVQMSIFYEVFIASITFMLLPNKLTRRVGAALTRERVDDASERAAEYVRERLSKTAEAFRELCGALTASFAEGRANDGDAASVFDRTADRICRSCALRDSCWQHEYNATFNALNDALPAMLDRGRGIATDFPEHFRMRCAKFAAFLSCANEELSALLTRRQYQNRLRESRGAVCRQYGELSDILGAAAAELSVELTPDNTRAARVRQYIAGLGLEGEVSIFYDRAGHLRTELEGRGFESLALPDAQGRLAALLGVPLREAEVEPGARGRARVVYCQAEPLMAVAGVSAVRRDGESVSGDTGTWFKHSDGTLYVLLCDGMGSGAGAHRESSLAVRLLEKFLRAGVAPDAALKTLNSALALRGEENGGFTTVDLLSINLFTGESAIYKYGAAPTYLKKGDVVTRVAGASLPAGLITGDGAAPDVVRFRLAPGHCVALVSDGVVSGDDTWLREEFGRFDGASPKALACALVGRAGGEEATDDKTALVLRIGTRG